MVTQVVMPLGTVTVGIDDPFGLVGGIVDDPLGAVLAYD
jgi:hypothetical protein